jgi:hypothetical protein
MKFDDGLSCVIVESDDACSMKARTGLKELRILKNVRILVLRNSISCFICTE